MIEGKKAAQPCPCGYLGDSADRCICSVNKVELYRAKLSGPMLDRFDVHVRGLQIEGQADLNNRLAGVTLEEHCQLDGGINQFLDMACERLYLSARAYHRILSLAREIADMSGKSSIEQSHIVKTVGYRSLDRQSR